MYPQLDWDSETWNQRKHNHQLFCNKIVKIQWTVINITFEIEPMYPNKDSIFCQKKS